MSDVQGLLQRRPAALVDLDRTVAAVELDGAEVSPPVLAATAWPSNAELIEDVAKLRYLRLTDRVLDPTYGRGVWWRRWRPVELVTHDVKLDGVDFRRLPEASSSFDAVAFDPPYVSVGGRKTTGMPDFHDRYGLGPAPSSPAELQQMIDAGLVELARVLRPHGVLLVKCADYISSGRLWPGTHLTLSTALEIGFELIDRLEHVARRPRSQPPRTRADGQPVRQQHSRRNLSTLLVLRAPVPSSKEIAGQVSLLDGEAPDA
ncbi:MAG TPA: hypothetical protein VGW74_07010 [Propionibacteriaceae bacterium]|nr:hypothetical protein [Propionibacteriaceae bacterium]